MQRLVAVKFWSLGNGGDQGDLAGETKRPYICALQCPMRRCLRKATAMRPNAIFFLLHFGAKPQNYGFGLAHFSLSCILNAISLSRIVFHMESEKHTVSFPMLKLSCGDFIIKSPSYQ